MTFSWRNLGLGGLSGRRDPSTRQPTHPLRWGIIGFGKHAEGKKLPAMTQAVNALPYAIATRGRDRAATLSEKYPDLEIYSSYEALLEDPGVDAVYIGLPNHVHKEWSIKAVEAGKHVLCDKPAALNLEEALEMREAARKADRKLREAFMYRLHPLHQQVRALCSDGALGDVRLFEAHFHYTRNDLGNIRLKKDCGGGGLYDVGSYLVDGARYFLGREPEHACATWHIDEQSGIDDSCFIQLLFGDGVAAHLSCGCRFGSSNHYAIYGSKGRIAGASFTLPRDRSTSFSIEVKGKDPQTIPAAPCNPYVLEFEGFADWVAGEPVAAEFPGDGVETLRILDAVRRSADTGELVRISDV